jgi:hypothetical protein
LVWIVQDIRRVTELYNYNPITNLTGEAQWESQGKEGERNWR